MRNITNIMDNIYRVIDTIRSIVVIAIFVFIVTIGAIQIFMRYTPGISSLVWVDEIMRYLNIWVIFLAASIAVKNNAHLKLDYFVNKIFFGGVLLYIIKATHITIIIALGIIIFLGTQRVIANLNTVIQCLPISISLFYAAIPIGSSLILLDYLLILINGEHPYAPCEDNEE